MSKTPQQIKEFTNLMPTGTIVGIPYNAQCPVGWLPLDGNSVLKSAYPQLGEVLKATPFDKGDKLVLDENFIPGFSLQMFPTLDEKYIIKI